MKPKVYIETSVVSYLTARPSRDPIIAAHQNLTRKWWEQERAKFELFTSRLVVDEARAGDPQAAKLRLEMLRAIPRLVLTRRAKELAREFINRGYLPLKATEDALHIATATVHKMDYLLTWNCKHIANADVQRNLAGICKLKGRQLPITCTPEKLMEE